MIIITEKIHNSQSLAGTNTGSGFFLSSFLFLLSFFLFNFFLFIHIRRGVKAPNSYNGCSYFVFFNKNKITIYSRISLREIRTWLDAIS